MSAPASDLEPICGDGWDEPGITFDWMCVHVPEPAVGDWSGEVVHCRWEDALDSEAVSRARECCVRGGTRLSQECAGLEDAAFLGRIGLVADGRPTNAAMVLLGKEGGGTDLIGDIRPGIEWVLCEADGSVRAAERFGTPLLLSVERIFDKMRNHGDGGLPCDPSTIRELTFNCIAHQDYTMGEPVEVVEYERDKLVFTNAGEFIPGTVEDVLSGDVPTGRYRNRVLVEAMAKLGLMEVAGGGIKRACRLQCEHSLPTPRYDTSGRHVKVTLTTNRAADPRQSPLMPTDPPPPP